jgi:hypothetical protein
MGNFKPRSREEDLVVQESDGEVLLYDTRSDKAFCLNQTSAEIWNACDGKNDVHEIANMISNGPNAKLNEDVVWLALDQLKQNDLLSKGSEFEKPFGGLSRRDVIKKIGLSTAMALPVVFSLVAPKPIHAQTACTPVTGGCVCAAGSGPNGALCTNVTTPCANPTCRCFKANNSGGAGSGNCVP